MARYACSVGLMGIDQVTTFTWTSLDTEITNHEIILKQATEMQK